MAKIYAVILAVAPMLSALVSAEAAVHIDEFGCGYFDGNGGFTFADTSSAVITYSGNANMKCQGEVAPPAGGQAVQYNFENTGFPCFVFGGAATEKWQQVVSASGQATLTCHVGH